jgi:hypothetical protein
MKPITLIRSAALAAGIAGLAILGGCHSSAPEETVANNLTNFVETANAMAPENIEVPVETPVTNATAAPSNPGADFTTDEQTYDDAAATGMTSRIPEDNASQPAEESKQ